MATFLFLVQLLFLGTLITPAHTQTADRCSLLLNATRSNFNITVTPEAYQANTTYTVEISDDNKGATEYLLQALNPQNVSTGEWKLVKTDNCSSIDTAVLDVTQKTANWTSLDSHISSVEIRAYIIISDKSAQLNTVTLHRESNTTSPPTTTPNSVTMIQSSSFFIAAVQLPLLFVTSKLLS